MSKYLIDRIKAQPNIELLPFTEIERPEGCDAAVDAKVAPSADGCEECLKLGQDWVHLRICRICGHVGCCDLSIGRHGTKHFHATGHPVMEAYYAPDGWGWCYVDEAMIDLDGDVTPHPPGSVW